MYQNDHITGVDTLNIIGYDTIGLPIFQTLVIEQEDRNFLRSIRALQYPNLSFEESKHLYADIDRYSPADLSLDMFSMRELTDQSVIGFYGYDYLGRKARSGATFDDF